MNSDECIDEVYRQTMSKEGFMWGVRENRVDEKKYQLLRTAISELASQSRHCNELNKLLCACLFEVPWELENTVDHYMANDATLGRKVSGFAEELRDEIQKLLWGGLEEKYESIA